MKSPGCRVPVVASRVPSREKCLAALTTNRTIRARQVGLGGGICPAPRTGGGEQVVGPSQALGSAGRTGATFYVAGSKKTFTSHPAPQATAPAEGGTGTEERQGPGNPRRDDW